MDNEQSSDIRPVGGNQRKLTFISEGSADIEGQQNSEEQAQNKFENEKLRRSRKSLNDQLRSNAASKQKEFRKQVKKREKFNRLNKDELKFFKDIENNESKQEKEMESYLNNKLSSFERKQRLLETKINPESTVESITKVSVNGTSISNKIVKKKTKKIKIKIGGGSLNSK